MSKRCPFRCKDNRGRTLPNHAPIPLVHESHSDIELTVRCRVWYTGGTRQNAVLKHQGIQSVRLVGAAGIEPTTSSMPWERAPSCATGPRLKTKSPRPPNRGSRQVPNSFSPPAFHADAPIYIAGVKTRIPAEPVTCERICGST